MKHFGVEVREGKYGSKLTREHYAIINNRNTLKVKFARIEEAYADEQGKFYTQKWCAAYREMCLENFDLNMRFFKSLDHEDFDNELNDFLKRNQGFKEVHDLNEYAGMSGYYLMVLDEYCQVYVGTTDDIKKRIRDHWTARVEFDRLLFPMCAVKTSILSIDSFRALDTTRIFAYATEETYKKENDYIEEFSRNFVTNRVSGGYWCDDPLRTARGKILDPV